MRLLRECGLSLAGEDGQLVARASNFPLEVLYLRNADIPRYVEGGVVDLAIVGRNTVEEEGCRVETLLDLGLAACRLSIAVPREVRFDGPEWLRGKRIATSYPNTLGRFLRERGVEAEIQVISGSVEIAPGIGLADGIFDIVSSGSTLVSNNLQEVAIVMKSEALLIGNPAMDAAKKAILDELLFRIEAVKSAEDKKYVLMNVPSDKVKDVVAVLPGAKSPTVMPLAQEGWSSVHTVIDESRFWEIISRLKELGAQGILVVPVEKMIL